MNFLISGGFGLHKIWGGLEKAFVLFSKEELYQAGFLNDDNTTVKGDICIDAKMNDPEKTDKIDRFTITKEEMDKALEELESL